MEEENLEEEEKKDQMEIEDFGKISPDMKKILILPCLFWEDHRNRVQVSEILSKRSKINRIDLRTKI